MLNKNVFPSFAKEGWPRHQEDDAEGHQSWRGRGGQSSKGSTTPPFAKKRANGTPNLERDFFAHLEECPNSKRGLKPEFASPILGL